ncbi:MAG: response regulator receiver protein [Polaromonas sp. 39-63-203]|jgi:excisionase family DNA binding protein|uniref:response regulator n=1 Tax=Polaromonas sp. TaxID=1869339 RepID=UPI000BD85F7E|nr:response regulator [Polaromonas sp.]OYY50905.1 MAG: response regulator receiver protein [Polaromonas sp. 35-63-240]OYY92148.1 MAG: response regulator receiver protein [Polaromonas sp. 28-63-22]OYZ81567.1 MAG: response regulator receiver protein [Polaromonas sp. 24-62-144]OZA95498.1 MAG: response regulator receiver protein [Polaromonas sp. 39-63-203]HQS32057.1 response regulator [Polaromonas sp.]
MPAEPKSFETAIMAPDFSSDDYCGTSYAAKLMGLSVATVQSLVEKGEIDAWKTLGGHRRIALTSINAYLARNSPQLTRADVDPKSRLRVLIVEDDENTRELYRCQLEEWDLAVDCTFMPSAIEALMDIASMRPDLLITDLSMPGVDGIEMLKALKRNQTLADMQIIVISGLSPDAVASRGGLPPQALLLPKPVNFDWLQGYLTALVTANRKWRR